MKKMKTLSLFSLDTLIIHFWKDVFLKDASVYDRRKGFCIARDARGVWTWSWGLTGTALSPKSIKEFKMVSQPV